MDAAWPARDEHPTVFPDKADRYLDDGWVHRDPSGQEGLSLNDTLQTSSSSGWAVVCRIICSTSRRWGAGRAKCVVASSAVQRQSAQASASGSPLTVRQC